MYKNLETPCFVIDIKKIDDLVCDARKNMDKYWPHGIIGYSFKTNNLPWILSYMKSKGLFAEVVSSDEYNLAKEIGYSIDHIIFNGPAKRKKEFIEAIENKAIVNIDSKRELNWLLECKKEKLVDCNIGLRVNFCIENYCPGESQCGKEDGRFGFSYESGELEEALHFFKNNSIKISGIHLHLSSKTRSINIYKAIANMTVEIISKFNLKLNYVDIGGGFFGGIPDKPSFKDYFKVVNETFNDCDELSKINLIIEPGMSLVGSGIDYVVSVIDVKYTLNNNFVQTDGSRIHIDPLMRKSTYSYYIVHVNQETSIMKNSQIICGFTCMENDRFFNLSGPSLEVNDLIIFEKVGAYTIGLSPQFIEFHPVIYANYDNEISVVQDKKTVIDFINDRKFKNNQI